MNKKFLSLVLALVLVLGTFTAVFAAETKEVKLTDADAKVQWLIDNKIVEGRKVNENAENNDLALDKNITRAEVTKLIVYALGYEDLAKMLDGAIKAFPDVELNHWANGYISVATTQRASVANNRRIAIGYPDGKFLPENDVTYAELATMLVRIVDKNLTDKMEDNAIWATSYMSWAAEAGILHGLTIADSDKATNRKDAFVMLYNALFELGKTNYNKVDFGAKLGVISKLQAGKIQLNQDTKQEYKIDWNTVMTGVYDNKNTGWQELANNASLPGTLARVIVNEEGTVTHIIQLGYNGKAYADTNWRGVADKAVSTVGNDYAVFNDTTTDGFKYVTINGVKMEITKDTKFFIADKDKNVYKEVEKLSDAFYYTGNKNIEKVYGGYNEYKNWNEAQVIVFGKVQKDFYGKDLVRIYQSANSLYNVYAEDTKGDVKSYDLYNTNVFPGTYSPDKYDVINLNSYANNVDYGLVIDHSKDNVYAIYKVNLADKEITLEDKDGFRQEFTLKDTDFFLRGDVKVDAHVQTNKDIKDGDIEVLSVVPTSVKLKGELPNGTDSTATVGVVEEVSATKVTIKTDRRSYTYAITDVTVNADKLEVGNKVRVSLGHKDIASGLYIVTNVEFIEYPAALTKAWKELKDLQVTYEGLVENLDAAVEEYEKAEDALAANPTDEDLKKALNEEAIKVKNSLAKVNAHHRELMSKEIAIVNGKLTETADKDAYEAMKTKWVGVDKLRADAKVIADTAVEA